MEAEKLDKEACKEGYGDVRDGPIWGVLTVGGKLGAGKGVTKGRPESRKYVSKK